MGSVSGWEVCFYADPRGEKPVKDYLAGLEYANPDEYDTVHRKLELFRRRGWAESLACGLLKPVQGKIYEIKLAGGGQARILGFGWTRPATGQQYFVAAAAESKKKDELNQQTVCDAEARRQDWLAQHAQRDE